MTTSSKVTTTVMVLWQWCTVAPGGEGARQARRTMQHEGPRGGGAGRTLVGVRIEHALRLHRLCCDHRVLEQALSTRCSYPNHVAHLLTDPRQLRSSPMRCVVLCTVIALQCKAFTGVERVTTPLFRAVCVFQIGSDLQAGQFDAKKQLHLDAPSRSCQPSLEGGAPLTCYVHVVIRRQGQLHGRDVA